MNVTFHFVSRNHNVVRVRDSGYGIKPGKGLSELWNMDPRTVLQACIYIYFWTSDNYMQYNYAVSTQHARQNPWAVLYMS